MPDQPLQKALSSIIHDRRFTHGNFAEVISYIVEHSAIVMGCQRVSAWKYHAFPHKHIECLDLWDREDGTHIHGMMLGEDDASAYLNALEKDLLMVMDDVATDQRCSDLMAEYLPSFGITSMLDAPFQYNGELAGVLCFEHVGEARVWSSEEQNFAANMASLLSIATERNNRRLIEQQLLEEKNRYRELVHSSPEGIAILIDGVIEFCNPALNRIAESAGVANLLGLKASDIFTPSLAKMASMRQELLVSSKNSETRRKEYQFSLQDGSLLYLEISSVYLVWNGKDAVQSNVRNVTEEVHNRQALEKYAEQLHTLANSFPGAFSYIDKEKIIRVVNSTMANWLNIDAEDIKDRSLVSFFGEDIYNQISPYTESALEGENVTFEYIMQYPGTNGREVQMSYVPDKDSNGKVRGYFALLTDLSQIKDAERALRHAQKMEAVGQLSGGIAHDFNNLLLIIMGNLELLQGELSTDTTSKKYLDSAMEASKRGAQLTRKLLGFSRQNSSRSELVNINDSISNLLGLLNKSLTASVNVELLLNDNLWLVNINAGDLEDTILNLALNSRDAMDGKGLLTITTENKNIKGLDYVLMSVSDTGAGIEKSFLDKVFEPFYTTKSEDKGSGLGLSMVYGFVQRSNGIIEVESTVGEGTTFHIFFPRTIESVQKQTSIQASESSLPSGSETILVVDDEDDLLKAVVGMLEKLGYQTLQANTANSALEIIAGESHIDLLFSDIVLGGELDGHQLALQALEYKPEIKILLTSGFDKTEQGNLSEETFPINRLLKKPYELGKLATTIRLSLDQ